MNLFFHHVGQDGADRDFPKTIFQKHNIDKLVSEGAISNTELVDKLKLSFPDGEFNCWGVPAGAQSVIRNLSEGDYVLLVASIRINGDIPVICPVKTFWRHELRELSQYLWQESKFPFIFFFNTISIELLWIEFLDNINYKPNFNPRGNFYKVRLERLAKFGGVEQYIYHLINKRSDYRGENINISLTNEESLGYGLFTLQDEEKQIIALTLSTPKLHDTSNTKKVVRVTKREQAFSLLIKRYYNFKCAICNSELKSPEGYPAVHSAHIYPKSKQGNDDLRNGICLCFLHHWAFDAGWISIDDNYKIIIRKDIPRIDDYRDIFRWENCSINLPINKDFWPHVLFLNASRELYGFSSFSGELPEE